MISSPGFGHISGFGKGHKEIGWGWVIYTETCNIYLTAGHQQVQMFSTASKDLEYLSYFCQRCFKFELIPLQ
jgi:hypothetical protein